MNEQLFFELVQKHLRGDISNTEQSAMQEAMDSNTEYQAIFQYVSQSSVSKLPAQELEVKANQIIHRAKPTLRLSKMHYLAIAASIAVFFFLFSYVCTRLQGTAYQELYATQNGERKHTILPDGTAVWLNSGSSIQIKSSYGKTDRDIMLTGEAFFDVQKNKALPMLIQTKQMLIKVVGTSFNVRSYADEPLTETSLIEGKIEMYLSPTTINSQKVTMQAGDKIMFSSQKATLKPADIKILKLAQDEQDGTSIQTEIAWRENTLAFDNEPIALAIPKLEKWFNQPITLENKDLANIKFTGTFKETQIEEVLKILQLSGLNFQFTKKDQKIIIY